MVNSVRGEVPLEIDGKTYKLCLTLGALAEIEDSLKLESIKDLDARLTEKPRVNDFVAILLALLHGGGHDDVTKADLMKWPMNLGVLMPKIMACFSAGDDSGNEPSLPGL
jgi:hypothetical protein